MCSDRASAPEMESKRIEAVFFLNTDVDQGKNNWLNTLEVGGMFSCVWGGVK